MPFDTNVPGPIQLELRPPQVQNPLEAAAQFQEMRYRSQAMQTQQLQQQEMQLNLEQRKAINDAYRQAFTQQADGSMQLDDTKLTNALATAGHGEAIPGIMENLTKYRKSLADLQETNQKVAASEADAAGNLGATVKAANNDPTLFHTLLTDAMNRKIIQPAHFAPFDQAISQAMQSDPTGESARGLVQKYTDQMIAGSPAQQKLINERTTAAAATSRAQSAATEAGNNTTKLNAELPGLKANSDIATYKARMGLVGNGEYDQFLAQYARSLGKTPAELTPQEGLASFQKFAEFKQDPTMRGLAIAQKNLAEALQRTQLEGAPTKEDAQMLADDIVNHRLAPDQISQIRGRGNGALGIMIERAIRQQNPNFNWEEASSEYNLAKSQGFQNTVRYMDSVQESIPLVIDRAQKLANGGVKGINALINAGKNQFNDIDLKRFNTDRTLVSDEIAKILQGGGTGSGTSDMKLKQAGDILGSTDSPAAIAAALGDVKQLIGYRRTALTKGTYLENSKAQPSSAGAGKITVKAGDGSLHPFDTEEQAKAFESLVKQHGGSTTRQ